MARHERVIVDMGTGDGRAAIALAAAEPTSLVVAMDANAAAMADASRRAARSAGRDGRSNALFVVAAAEAPPAELHGLADEVRILFPWGSLLRGVLGRDESVAGGLVSLARAGGRTTVLLSVTERDGLHGLGVFDEKALEAIRCAHAGRGLDLADARRATVDEVRATRSTWGRRLLAGAPDRPVWRLELVRRPAGPPGGLPTPGTVATNRVGAGRRPGTGPAV